MEWRTMARQRYRVAPEPPQLSLREEVAIYKAKMRAIKATREAAAKQAQSSQVVIKPKKRSKTRNERSKKCFQAIGHHLKSVYNNVFSNFKRKLYLCMGFACCISSEISVFVDEEYPTSRVPVV